MAATRRPPSIVVGREPVPSKSLSPRSVPPKPARPAPTVTKSIASAPSAFASKVGPPRPGTKARSLAPAPQSEVQPRASKIPGSASPSAKLGSHAHPRKLPPPLPGARVQAPPFPGSQRPSLASPGERAVQARSRSLAPKADRATPATPSKSRSQSMVPHTLKPAKR